MTEIVPLFEICRPKQWKTISSANLLEDGYPVYGANGRIGFYSEYTHEAPTVLITCRGATCGTVNVSEPRSYVNGNAMALDNLDVDRVDRSYLKFYLQNRGFKDVISGSAQPQITRTGLRLITLPLPPLDEQRRIAAILDKADAVRAKRREAIAKLDQLLQSVFLEMFGDPVSNNMKWHTATLLELSRDKFANGIFQKNDEYLDRESDEGMPVVWVDQLFRGEYIDLTNTRRLRPSLKELEKFTLETGDILFCRSSLKLDGIAYNNVFMEREKSALFECHLIRMRPDLDKVDPVFLNRLLRMPSSRETIKLKSKTATMTTIDQKALGSFTSIVPPLEKQIHFRRVADLIARQKASLKKALGECDDLFSALQQQAFIGKL